MGWLRYCDGGRYTTSIEREDYQEVCDHKQEDNRAKRYVTKYISQVKSVPTTPHLPTTTKARSTRINRSILHLQQEICRRWINKMLIRMMNRGCRRQEHHDDQSGSSSGSSKEQRRNYGDYGELKPEWTTLRQRRGDDFFQEQEECAIEATKQISCLYVLSTYYNFDILVVFNYVVIAAKVDLRI
jgi:hypothetical protein